MIIGVLACILYNWGIPRRDATAAQKAASNELLPLQGHTLFQTHDNLEHLAMMTRILGDFPQHLIRRTKTSFFQPHGRLAWDWNVPAARYASQHCRPLPQYRRHSPVTGVGQEESIMLDLIARMLEYEPDRRLTLKEALKHPFFDRLSVFQKLEEVSKHILRLQI